MYDIFQHFTENEWVYESAKIYEFEARMTPEERTMFYIDTKTFDWAIGTSLYLYGIRKFIWKEDAINPIDSTTLIGNKNHYRYFDNFRKAF